MVIFHSHVSLPEGKPSNVPTVFPWFSYGFPIGFPRLSWGFPIFLWFSQGFPFVFLGFSHCFPRIFPWFSQDFALLKSHELGDLPAEPASPETSRPLFKLLAEPEDPSHPKNMTRFWQLEESWENERKNVGKP